LASWLWHPALERLVDFDRLNAGTTRFSVGAVNVRTGNFFYFDTTAHTIRLHPAQACHG
jgi:predicted acylesterase/phospholipase RssA